MPRQIYPERSYVQSRRYPEVTRDYIYDDGQPGSATRCADPVTRTKAIGDKTRVTITSARDARPVAATDHYTPPIRIRRDTYPRPTRNYSRSRSRERYRRSRSRSRSRSRRRYGRDVGSVSRSPPPPPRRRSRSRSPVRIIRDEEIIKVYPDQDEEHRRRAAEAELRREKEKIAAEERGRQRTWGQSQEPSEPELFPDGDDVSVLEFDLTLPSSDGKSDDDWTASSSTEAGSSETGLRPGLVNETWVDTSRWIGSTLDDWNVAAELLTSARSSKIAKPMIKWLHLERALMNFDEFVAVAKKSLTLRQDDVRHVEEMLRKAQREHEKQRAHGREMEPFCIGDVDYDTAGDKEKQTASVCFLSLPFFALERQSENHLKSLSAGSPDHPSRPLVQSYTRTFNERREMMQAVTTMPTTQKGSCLHVSNIWVLVVNEDLLVTCSRASVDTMKKDVLKVKIHEKHEQSIRLRAGNIRSWAIPTRYVRSWPNLVSLFTDRLENITGSSPWASIKKQGRVMTSELWTGSTNKSYQNDIHLTIHGEYGYSFTTNEDKALALEESRKIFGPQVGKVNGQSARSPTISPVVAASESVRQDGPDTPDVSFLEASDIRHMKVFQHSTNGSQSSMTALADTLHEAIVNSKQKMLKNAYDACPQAVRSDIANWLREFSSETAKRARSVLSSKERKLMQQKEWIAVMAQYVFGFFWPIDYDHDATRVFWGALLKLLEGDAFYGSGHVDRHQDRQMAEDFFERLSDEVLASIAAFTRSFSGHEDLLRPLPDHYAKAWLCISGSFIIAAAHRFRKDHRSSHWRIPTLQFWQVQNALRDGERALTLRLRNGLDIENFEVCSSRGIVALLLDRLSKDVTHGSPDVAQTYGDYFQQLEAKIMAEPLLRSHQETVRLLHQELDAIANTLALQLDVVNVFERSVQELDADERLPNLPAFRSSRQENVMKQTKATISSRMDQFKALQGRANDLGDWHLNEIDTNKDRQEAAIMVFTIVTIIFLPLSFVASVLGMNTADIRDMSQQQWVYWAAAVPLTVVVVGGSLWWAGALEDLGTWLARSTARPQAAVSNEAAAVQVVPTSRRADFAYPEKVQAYAAGPRRRTTYPVRHRHDGQQDYHGRTAYV